MYVREGPLDDIIISYLDTNVHWKDLICDPSLAGAIKMPELLTGAVITGAVVILMASGSVRPLDATGSADMEDTTYQQI